ncbi:histidine kinase [Rhodobacterales bacterium]|nr:histidine kinase [Rhodobacterales bacterium]
MLASDIRAGRWFGPCCFRSTSGSCAGLFVTLVLGTVEGAVIQLTRKRRAVRRLRAMPSVLRCGHGCSIHSHRTLGKLDLGAIANVAEAAACLTSLAIVLCAYFPAVAAPAATPDKGQRVLILYENESTLPAIREIAQGLHATLESSDPTGIEFYSEFLDIVRFETPAYRALISEFLQRKYAGLDIDAVAAIGPGALGFAVEDLGWINTRVPVVAGAVSKRSLEARSLPRNFFGVVSSFDVRRTAGLAARLHPDRRELVVLAGSSDFDRNWLETVRVALGPEFEGLKVSFLTGLTLDGFRQAVATLGSRSILLVLTVFEDADGRKFVPRDVAGEILPGASAPSYSVYSSFIGTGIVGGELETFTGIGNDVGALVRRLLQGATPEQNFVPSSVVPILDWRQAKRWSVDPSLIPADAVLKFYNPPAWERYRWQIVLGLTIIALQSTTIFGILLVERRRKRMAKELALGRLQLAHMSRVSQLGQLSGSIAHELNQPLTSILANAEAGVRIVERDDPDIEEVRDIFADIVAADKRASETIANLRKLLTNREIEFSDFDLNVAVADTIKLARSELAARRTRADVVFRQEPLPVRGNFSQLQQITLNLILNACDAMSDLPASLRKIDVETGLKPDGTRYLSVADAGRGMPQEMREAAFKPFISQTSKGMGLGLPICRSIAMAHGGDLEFDEDRQEGVRIVLTLPKVED